MKYLLFLLMVPFLSAGECGKKKEKVKAEAPEQKAIDSTVLPACVQQIIDNAGKEDPPNLPQQIDEYVYKGKKVYYVTAPCCDFFNMVYDDSCKVICAPSGGITGKGDGRCIDFDADARQIRTLWKKPAK